MHHKVNIATAEREMGGGSAVEGYKGTIKQNNMIIQVKITIFRVGMEVTEHKM